MLLTGHKTRAIFDRYNIINEQELLEAGDQLVAYLAQHAQATPRGARTRPARAPRRPSASCDAPPRSKGARSPAPARYCGRPGPDTARLGAAGRVQTTGTSQPAIVAPAATGLADAANHGHARRHSTTSSCNDRHLQDARTPTCSGVSASAGCSVSTRVVGPLIAPYALVLPLATRRCLPEAAQRLGRQLSDCSRHPSHVSTASDRSAPGAQAYGRGAREPAAPAALPGPRDRPECVDRAAARLGPSHRGGRHALRAPALGRDIDQWVQSGALVMRSLREDPVLAGHRHETFIQAYQGIPVYGGSLVRQTARGVPVSVIGTLVTGITVDPTPTLSAARVAAIWRRSRARPSWPPVRRT